MVIEILVVVYEHRTLAGAAGMLETDVTNTRGYKMRTANY